MRRAGKAAAEFLVARTTQDCGVVLFVGPGNNGGDALACAAELAVVGYAPVIVLLGDPSKFGEDAARVWQRVVELQSASNTSGSAPSPLAGVGWGEGEVGVGSNLSSADHVPPLPPRERGQILVTRTVPALISADWVVDGLFGIGLKRPLNGVYLDAVKAIAIARANGAHVLSLDVPSGVDADTGATLGDAVVHADITLTFIANKRGLVTGPALDYAGELLLAPLGVQVPAQLNMPHLLTSRYLAAVQRTAQANAHKGSHGTCMIIGGASGMLGAALLASRAAMIMQVPWLPLWALACAVR